MHSHAPVPPPAEGAREEERRSRRRRLLPACILGVLAVIVPVLWVTGGLKEKPKQPAVKAGEKLDLGLFAVTVRDARIGPAKAAFGTTRERFLIVRMRVVNKGKETKPLGDGGLSDGVAALTKNGKWVEPDEAVGVAGGAETTVAQPELPVEASVMWKLSPSEAPTKLTVGLRMWKYEQGFTNTSFNWNVQKENNVLVGRLTLPVTPETTGTPNRTPPSRATRPTRPATRATPPTTRRPTAPTTRRPTASLPRSTARRS
ncbi:MAG TPA: hypothetical protein VIL71_12110 [Spirillospora sp.]